MQDNSAKPRNFNPMSVPGLSDEPRKAVNAAFDAMSAWRIETANSNEKNSEEVIEKMAAAARALGWPEQIVDATRAQLQSITKMQIQTIDQMMDALEEQIKSPNPMTASPSAMLSKLKSLPGVSPAGSWPNADAFPMAAMNPMQFWMQLAEQWHKAWADVMGFGEGQQTARQRRIAPPLISLPQRPPETRTLLQDNFALFLEFGLVDLALGEPLLQNLQGA
jgi:hypothetical protein